MNNKKTLVAVGIIMLVVGAFVFLLVGIRVGVWYTSSQNRQPTVAKETASQVDVVEFNKADTASLETPTPEPKATPTVTSTPEPTSTPTPVDPCGIQALAKYMQQSVNSLDSFVTERGKIAPGEVSPPRIRPPLLEMKKIRKNADSITVPQCEQTEKHYQLLIEFMDQMIKAQEAAIEFDIETSIKAQLEANNLFDQVYEATYFLKEEIENIPQ
jgi:hypothetical protein